MASHSSTFAWKIPWTEKPGGLQSMGSLESDTTERLHFHFSLSCIGEENGNPLQCSCLENPRDGGAWWAAVHGVAQSQTRLKQLSSSSSSSRWHANGWVPPLVSFDGTGPMQPELWKALVAMAPVILHRPLKEQRYIVRACIHSPYAFLLARNQSDL